MANSNFKWLHDGLQQAGVEAQCIPDKTGKCCLKVIHGVDTYPTSRLNKKACAELVQALKCNDKTTLYKYSKKLRQVKDEHESKYNYTKYKRPVVVFNKKDDATVYVNGSKYNVYEVCFNFHYKEVETRTQLQQYMDKYMAPNLTIMQVAENFGRNYYMPDTVRSLFFARRRMGSGRSYNAYLKFYQNRDLCFLNNSIIDIKSMITLCQAWCNYNNKDIEVTKDMALKVLDATNELIGV